MTAQADTFEPAASSRWRYAWRHSGYGLRYALAATLIGDVPSHVTRLFQTTCFFGLVLLLGGVYGP